MRDLRTRVGPRYIMGLIGMFGRGSKGSGMIQIIFGPFFFIIALLVVLMSGAPSVLRDRVLGDEIA